MKRSKGMSLLSGSIHGIQGAIDSLDRQIVAWGIIGVRRSLPGATVDNFLDGLKSHRKWLQEQLGDLREAQKVLRIERRSKKK